MKKIRGWHKQKLRACITLIFGIFLASSGTALNNAIENDISLDVDENGSYDALTDGLLILRHMFGLTDQALIANAIGLDAQVTSPEEITSKLQSFGTDLDIDQDGDVNALTDGLLILRFLFGTLFHTFQME